MKDYSTIARGVPGLIIAWMTMILVFVGNSLFINVIGLAGTILVLLTLFMPSHDWKGLKEQVHKMTRWNVSITWYLLALLVPLAVELLALALFSLVNGKYLPLSPDYWNWSYVAGLFPKVLYVSAMTIVFSGFVLWHTPKKYIGLVRGLIFCLSSFAALALLIIVAILQDSNNPWLFIGLWIYEKTGKSLLLTGLFFLSFLALELMSPVNWLLGGGFPEAMMYGAVLYFLIAIILIVTDRRFFLSSSGNEEKTDDLVPGKRGISLPPALLAAIVVVGITSLIFVLTMNADMSYPEPSGSYEVGRIAYDWIDHNRTEIATGNVTDRELMVYVWYPACATENAKEAPMMDAKTAAAIRSGGMFTLGFLGGLSDHAYQDVPISTNESQYPLLIMSHGDSSSPLMQAVTAADPASHGYIVAGISHTYNARGTVFPDGRVTSQDYNYSLISDDYPNFSLSYYENAKQWASHNADVEQREADDVSFVLDQLEQLNSTDALFQGRIDTSRVGTFGHSLGGAAAITSAEQDERIDAAADLDGALYHDPNITKPAMLLECGSRIGYNRSYDVVNQRLLTPEQFAEMKVIWDDSEYRVLTSPPAAYYVGIKGTEHANFKDYGPLGIPLNIGTVDGRYATRIIDSYLLAFLDKYLDGVDSPLLVGQPVYPEVVFKKYDNGTAVAL
jgi:pimeloyl-ACP methyl ester carboxylesterase